MNTKINKVDYSPIKSKTSTSAKGKITVCQGAYIFRVRCEDGWHNLNDAINLGIVERSEQSERLTGARGELIAKSEFPSLFKLVGLTTPNSVKVAAMEATEKIAEREHKRELRERAIIEAGEKVYVKDAKGKAIDRFAKLVEKYAEDDAVAVEV